MITYDVDADGIATITWDMPGRSMNVLTEDSIRAFGEAVDRAIADEAVRGAIVTSAKPAFLAGADLDLMGKLDDAAKIVAFNAGVQRIFRAIETGGTPFAAAINGTALGGGYEICLACHHRVAADNPRAQIGLPEIKVGLFPGAGGTQRLPRMIGIRQALPFLLEGKTPSPKDALAAGLVDRVVPADTLLAEAKRWLIEEADPVKPWDKKGFKIPGGDVQSRGGYETFVAGNAMLHQRTFGNYPAALAIMSCVYEGLQVPIDVGLRVETRYFARIALSPTAKAMIRTLFFSMGEAKKLARRPKNVPKSELKKVGVLGAGMMGHGIAHASAAAGLAVTLVDASAALAEAGKAKCAALFDKQIKRGRLAEAERDAALARIAATDDYAALADADLVIEAVTEDRAIKADVTGRSEAVMAETAVFASNTSTLPITGLAEASARPANFIGLHFFSPVERMPLVEIIVGKRTSDAALALAMDYVRRIGKTPIVVNDSRGFYTSRVFGTYLREGLAMLAEGVNPALIENAGRLAGMPVGPLALADEVSIGLMHHVMKQTRADLGDAYPAQPGDDVIALFVDQLKRPGKAAGRGFYDYPEDGRKRLWPELAAHFPRAAEQPGVDEVKRRLLHIQGVETARCLEEKVVTEPRDADVGSILGWGFAPFTGGVVSYVDGIGVDAFVRQCDEMAGRLGPRFAPPDLLRRMAAEGRRFYAA